MIERFDFSDLRELFAKANEEKSGDQLAGIAARSERERVAAKRKLADMPLDEIVRRPLIDPSDDDVTRLILAESGVPHGVSATRRPWERLSDHHRRRPLRNRGRRASSSIVAAPLRRRERAWLERRHGVCDSLLPGGHPQRRRRVARAASCCTPDRRTSGAGDSGKPIRLYGLPAKGVRHGRPAQPDLEYSRAWREPRAGGATDSESGRGDDESASQRLPASRRIANAVILDSRRPLKICNLPRTVGF
jgi:Ethanolamine ammonia lyase large subunit (EutB)